MAAGSATLTSNSALEGAPFSNAEHHPIIDEYSPAIRASIAFHSDLSSYEESELATTHSWIVFSSQAMGPAACLLYTSPSPRDATLSRMPSSA